MSKPENYDKLSIYDRYIYYSSLRDEDIDTFLSHLSSNEKKELYLEGRRLEEEEKEKE